MRRLNKETGAYHPSLGQLRPSTLYYQVNSKVWIPVYQAIDRNLWGPILNRLLEGFDETIK